MVRVLCLDHQAAGRERLGLAWAFETSKPIPSDTLPPTSHTHSNKVTPPNSASPMTNYHTPTEGIHTTLELTSTDLRGICFCAAMVSIDFAWSCLVSLWCVKSPVPVTFPTSPNQNLLVLFLLYPSYLCRSVLKDQEFNKLLLSKWMCLGRS